MLTVNTAARTTALLLRFSGSQRAGLLARWLLVIVMVLGISGLSVPRRRLRLGYSLAFVLVGCALWQAGCAGSTSSVPVSTPVGTPAGSYTVTVAGAAGTEQETTSMTLVVK
jgi:hypothetical protein